MHKLQFMRALVGGRVGGGGSSSGSGGGGEGGSWFMIKGS